MGFLTESILASYLRGEIGLRDIPPHMLDKNIIEPEMKNRPYETIEYLLEKIKDGSVKLDVSKYIKKIGDKTKQGEYWQRYFEVDPLKVISIIPSEYITYNMSIGILTLTKSLEKVPVHHRKFSLAKVAIESSVDNMQYIFTDGALFSGVKLSDYEQKKLCDVAYKKSPIALIYSPEQYTTADNWKKLVQTDYKYIVNCPPEFASKELWEGVVKKNILYWWLMPVKYIEGEQEIIDYLDAVKRAYADGNIDNFYGHLAGWNIKLPDLIFMLFQRKIPFINSNCVLEKISEIYPEVITLGCFPKELITQTMCNNLYQQWLASRDNIGYLQKRAWLLKNVPKQFVDSTLLGCDNSPGIVIDTVFDYIPIESRTLNIYEAKYGKRDSINGFDAGKHKGGWNAHVVYLDSLDEIEKVPKEKLDQDICNFLFAKYGISALEQIIPINYRTYEMWVALLNGNDFIKYFGKLPCVFIDDNLWNIIIKRLHAENGKGTVNASNELVLFVLEREPKVLNAFKEKIVNRVILDELYKFANNENGSLEDISVKYDVTPETVDSVLESIKEINANIYDKIKAILEKNRQIWHSNMLDDIRLLSSIINFLGIEDRNGDDRLTTEDKVKFSYLCSKYLHNSLDDIYKFNLKFGSESAKDYYIHLDKFFKRFLKFHRIYGVFGSYVSDLEADAAEVNISWLSPYNNDSFFAVKDGKPTVDFFFGTDAKDRKQLTMDIAANIVDLLKQHGIPLKHIIVRQAFRTYFTGDLDDYLGRVTGLDEEFGKFMSEGKEIVKK